MGRALLWLALACALTPFAYALGFCFPRGDDFDEVTRAMFFLDLPGGLYEIGREWLTWSGRYTYHFLAVFLGKAGEIRWLCGLIGATVLALHSLAFYGFAREAGVPRQNALPLACLALLMLCACRRYLWTYYMLTEMLTSGLQSAAALGFFWSLCALWNRCGSADATRRRRGRRTAALLGVLAVGVYEHAALAVMAGAGCACVLAWFHDRAGGLPFRAGRFRAFLGVALWCLGGVAFSFLAPGNFVRKQVRAIDTDVVRQQLAAVPGDWLHALDGFAHSSWIPAALGLALLMVLLRHRERPGPGRRGALLPAVLIPAVFCLFSLGLTILHALSDVPLHGAGKLPANLDFYAACALGSSAFALLEALPDPPARGRRDAVLLTGAALLALCCTSDNFQRILRNAVNGDMLLYGQAMEVRDAWLRHEGALSPWQGKSRFGLLGEILYPGSRSRRLEPDAAWTLVARWPRAVFPVTGGEALPAHAAHWPNLWVAWMYGVDAVASAPPEPAAAVAAVTDGARGPLELRLPAEARRHGLTGAWRVNARGGPNPTFALTWLVLACETPLPETLELLVPSPLSAGRLAPLPVQAWLLARLEREAAVVPDMAASWSAPELRFTSSAWRVPGDAKTGFRYAFPLGPAAPLAGGEGTPAPGHWPASLFVRLDGGAFLRLTPAAVLDTAPESG